MFCTREKAYHHTSYIIHYTSYIIHHTLYVITYLHVLYEGKGLHHTSYIIHHTSYVISYLHVSNLGWDGRSGWFLASSMMDSESTYHNSSAFVCAVAWSEAASQLFRPEYFSHIHVTGSQQFNITGLSNMQSPSHAPRGAVLAITGYDAGYTEELVRNNHLALNISLSPTQSLQEAEVRRLVDNRNGGVLFYHWNPSSFVTMLSLYDCNLQRISFQSDLHAGKWMWDTWIDDVWWMTDDRWMWDTWIDDGWRMIGECGTHKADGTGNWKCDFELIPVQKVWRMICDVCCMMFWAHPCPEGMMYDLWCMMYDVLSSSLSRRWFLSHWERE